LIELAQRDRAAHVAIVIARATGDRRRTAGNRDRDLAGIG
jgi:hypothetical protein